MTEKLLKMPRSRPNHLAAEEENALVQPCGKEFSADSHCFRKGGRAKKKNLCLKLLLGLIVIGYRVNHQSCAKKSR